MNNSKRINTTPCSEAGTKNQSSSGREPGIEFDYVRILSKAKIKTVSIAKIDQDDGTFAHRDSVTAAIRIEKDVAEAGTLDFATDHPVILQKLDQNHRIISGFRRIEAITEDGNIKRIRCRVLDAVSDHDAAIIAARCNLSHGQQLTVTEKKSCFLAEQSVRREAGYENHSDRAWARIYGVSPTTIGTWLKKADDAPTENDTPTPSVQIGHSTEEESGSETDQNDSPSKAEEATPALNIDVALAEYEAATAMFILDVEGGDFSDEHRASLREIIQRLQDVEAAHVNNEGIAA